MWLWWARNLRAAPAIGILDGGLAQTPRAYPHGLLTYRHHLPQSAVGVGLGPLTALMRWLEPHDESGIACDTGVELVGCDDVEALIRATGEGADVYAELPCVLATAPWRAHGIFLVAADAPPEGDTRTSSDTLAADEAAAAVLMPWRRVGCSHHRGSAIAAWRPVHGTTAGTGVGTSGSGSGTVGVCSVVRPCRWLVGAELRCASFVCVAAAAEAGAGAGASSGGGGAADAAMASLALARAALMAQWAVVARVWWVTAAATSHRAVLDVAVVQVRAMRTAPVHIPTLAPPPIMLPATTASVVGSAGGAATMATTPAAPALASTTVVISGGTMMTGLGGRRGEATGGAGGVSGM